MPWTLSLFSGIITKQLGDGGSLPLTGDFDGDGITDLVAYSQYTGTWYIAYSSGKGPKGEVSPQVIHYGRRGAVPVPADYDGDRITDLAVWDPNYPDGATYAIRYSSGRGPFDTSGVKWGLKGWVPCPGDYDGNGKADLCVYDSQAMTFYVINSSGRGHGGQPTTPFRLGTFSPLPMPGDYDGDGITDFAVYERGGGPHNEAFWIINFSSGHGPDGSSSLTTYLGDYRWVPVPADYDGDGKTDIAAYERDQSIWSVIASSPLRHKRNAGISSMRGPRSMCPERSLFLP